MTSLNKSLDVRDWMQTVQLQAKHDARQAVHRITLNDNTQLDELMTAARHGQQANGRPSTAGKIKSPVRSTIRHVQNSDTSDLVRKSLNLTHTAHTATQQVSHLFKPLGSAGSQGNAAVLNTAPTLSKTYSQAELQSQTHAILSTRPSVDTEAARIKQRAMQATHGQQHSSSGKTSGSVPQVEITSLDLSMLTLAHRPLVAHDIVQSLLEKPIHVQLHNNHADEHKYVEEKKTDNSNDDDPLGTPRAVDLNVHATPPSASPVTSARSFDLQPALDNNTKPAATKPASHNTVRFGRRAAKSANVPIGQPKPEPSVSPQPAQSTQSVSKQATKAAVAKQPVNYETPISAALTKLYAIHYKQLLATFSTRHTRHIFNAWYACVSTIIQHHRSAKITHINVQTRKYFTHWLRHANHVRTAKQQRHAEMTAVKHQQLLSQAEQHDAKQLYRHVFRFWRQHAKRLTADKQQADAKQTRQTNLGKLLTKLTAAKSAEQATQPQLDVAQQTNTQQDVASTSTITGPVKAHKPLKPHANFVPPLAVKAPVSKADTNTAPVTQISTSASDNHSVQSPCTTAVSSQSPAQPAPRAQPASSRTQRLAAQQQVALEQQREAALAAEQHAAALAADQAHAAEVERVQDELATMHYARRLLISTGWQPWIAIVQRSKKASDSAVRYAAFQRFKWLFKQWKQNVADIKHQRDQQLNQQLMHADTVHSDKLVRICYDMWRVQVKVDQHSLQIADSLRDKQLLRRTFNTHRHCTKQVVQHRDDNLRMLEQQCQTIRSNFVRRRYLLQWIDNVHAQRHHRSLDEFKQQAMSKVSGWLNDFKRANITAGVTDTTLGVPTFDTTTTLFSSHNVG